jgi:hypothetical protein
MAKNILPEFVYLNKDLQLLIKCPSIDFSESEEQMRKELEGLKIIGNPYITNFNDILKTFNKKNLNNEELLNLGGEMCSLSMYFSRKLKKKFFNASINIFIRACLRNDINTMLDLISIGKIFDNDDVKDIIIIDGVDDFDLNLLMKKLKNGLELSESEETTDNIFIDIIKEIKDNYLAKEQSYDFLPKLFKNDD